MKLQIYKEKGQDSRLGMCVPKNVFNQNAWTVNMYEIKNWQVLTLLRQVRIAGSLLYPAEHRRI